MKKRLRQCDPEKQNHWEGVLRRWGESGQTAREYCRAAGLREPAFYFWRRELARRRTTSIPDTEPCGTCATPVTTELRPRRAASATTAAQRPSTAQAALASSRQDRTPSLHGHHPSFLPVAVVQDAHPSAATDVEIVVSGRTLRVRPGFDRQTLIDVLTVLEAGPC